MQFSQQQLEEAYKQMEKERQTDAQNAQQAGDILKQLLRHTQPVVATETGHNRGAVTPYTSDHALVITLSQYDDWQQCYDDLVAAGVVMAPWNGNLLSAPHGEFDLSGNSQFSTRAKQKYTVRIDYYDGGY